MSAKPLLFLLLVACGGGANQSQEIEALKRRVTSLERRLSEMEQGKTQAVVGQAQGKIKAAKGEGKADQKAPELDPAKVKEAMDNGKGVVRTEGAVVVHLENGKQRFTLPAIAVPPAEYTAMAVFEAGAEPVDAGRINVPMGGGTVTCTASSKACTFTVPE